MTSFPFSAPSTDEPEVVHVAFRRAKLAWAKECSAVLLAEVGGTANVHTAKYLREAVAFAEDETHDAVTLYILAIRATRPATREPEHTAA